MATIDKSLPNEVRKEINIPSEEELQVEFDDTYDLDYDID